MVKVYGFFGDEQLYISDPRALQSVVVKDQDAFEETSVFIETNKIIFGPGLVATTGEQHKRQRKIVSPIFSTSQLKSLVPVFYTIAEKLAEVLSGQASAAQTGEFGGRSILDMSEWMCRVALEMVGQGVLGHSFDPLDSPQNNPYTAAIKELIPTIFSLALLRQFAPFFARLGSPAFRRRLVEWTPNKAVQKVKDISDVMDKTARDILEEKRETLMAEMGLGSQKDIISVLLRQNEKASEEEKLSDTELTGQMTVLIFGAQDTTSSTLSRILFELARNPYAQAEARREILDLHHQRKLSGDFSNRLDYDSLSSLPWLDAIIKESLRLYPPVAFVRRTAVKEKIIPYSPSDETDKISFVKVPKGTTLFVGIATANRLESIWGEDAKQWKPERWLRGEPSATLDSSVRLPGIYAGTLSFLGGGRSCVGYKFALLEMKIILSVLLSRFSFSITDDNIVWNLSQIISPSVRTVGADGKVKEEKGLPLLVEQVQEL